MIIKGRSCVAGSRIFVQEGINDEFLKIFTTTAAHLTSKTGDPFGKETEHGPQVSKVQFDVCPCSMEYILLTLFSSARGGLHQLQERGRCHRALRW